MNINKPKIAGVSGVIELSSLLVCMFMVCVVVLTIFSNVRISKNEDYTIETLKNVEAKQMILTTSKIIGVKSSIDFLRKKMNDSDFYTPYSNIDLNIIIDKKQNGKLNKFYMVYIVNKRPFYSKNRKNDLFDFIESLKNKDKESKNRKYYYASRLNLDKEITVKECIIDNDCVFIAGIFN